MKVAVYLRVSSESQTVKNQQADIGNWLKSHKVMPENVTYYSENESAWKLNNQKELSNLLENIRSGKARYDVLLCWSLDRLSRQGITSLIGLVNTLKTYGCRVVSVNDPWMEAPDSSLTEMFYAFIAWAAKFESDRKSERVRAAHARLRQQGKHLGRPKGSKDTSTRRKGGYYLRWQSKKVSGQNGRGIPT